MHELARYTAKSLYEKAFQHGLVLFEGLVDALRLEKQIPKRQMKGAGTYYSRHSLDELRQIRNINDFDEVDRKARAFYFPPFEPVYFILVGKKFYVYPENMERSI